MSEDFSYEHVFGKHQGGVDLVKSARLFNMKKSSVDELKKVNSQRELHKSSAFRELLRRMKGFQRFVGFLHRNGGIVFRRVEKQESNYRELKRDENDEFIKPHHPESPKPKEPQEEDFVNLKVVGVEFPKGNRTDYAELAEEKFGLECEKVENGNGFRIYNEKLAMFLMRTGMLPDTSSSNKPDKNGYIA